MKWPIRKKGLICMGLRENGAMNADKFCKMFSYEVNSYLEEKGGDFKTG